MAEMHFSVDVEANGPFPETGSGYSMTSFGAVATVTRENDGTVTELDIDDPANHFYAVLYPISEKVDPSAEAVAGMTYDYLVANGKSTYRVMSEFDTWVKHHAGVYKPTFVAWPAPFDWFWIYWYFMKFNGSSPFGFSGAINMKDEYAARAGMINSKVGKRKVYSHLGVTARPHTHNALDDAIEQADLWQAILKMA